ncbi:MULTISPECIES: DUF4340 domain-containing protein [Methylococcus]|uniref:DUF4340 domain-containing protein n=1 Tax=Methylococcus capsulatus TaxID=414 RepID=A0ABZ2F508_METCP|nr:MULTISPECIES: DUF4340 domain-containing protein [Methylococcus]MDF9391832.1 DUF4340 domain-containing protein [Methylococcus capsulatus]
MTHLNARAVLGLGAAAIIAVIAALMISSGRQPVSEPKGAGYALPGLRDHLNEIRSVTILGPENKTMVSLLKEEQGWKVLEKDGYPADSGKLREMLITLANAELLERKTANVERYADLGVEDVQAKEARGVELRVEGLSQSARLIVGKVDDDNSATFIRRPEEKQSWLAKGVLRIDRDPLRWLDKALTDIPSSRIMEIKLSQPGSKSLRLFKSKPEDSAYTVADLPSGREADPASGGLASTLAGLSLIDVFPVSAVTIPPESNLLNAQYRTFDGLTIEVKAWNQEGRHYAQFSAQLDPELAESHLQSEVVTPSQTADAGNTQSSPALATPDPDPGRRLDALNKEVELLNRRFSGRVFAIPADKYGNMDKSWADVLKPAPSAKTKGNRS